MDGRTSPLHEAARNNQDEVVRLLLDHGANHRALTNGDGKTPLDMSFLYRQVARSPFRTRFGTRLEGIARRAQAGSHGRRASRANAATGATVRREGATHDKARRRASWMCSWRKPAPQRF